MATKIQLTMNVLKGVQIDLFFLMQQSLAKKLYKT